MNVSRIAIIGCGLIGETHARCLAQLGNPPILFVDTDLTRANSLASQYGGTASANMSAAFEAREVEAVYICTYHDTHAPLAIKAAQHGKHIFLEKPMAITEQQCMEIVTAVHYAGIVCMTGFKLHYCSLARKAKQLIKTPQVLSARVAEKRWPDDSWANDPKKGGGNVLSQGCHAVEMLCYLAGSRPLQIFAEGGNLRHDAKEIVDTMAATISFESGAAATLLIGDAGEMPHDGKFNFEAMNGKETVQLYNRLTSLSYFDGEREQLFTGEEDGFLNENGEFLTAVAERRQPETNEADGLRAEMILLRGIESMRAGMPQSLRDLP